MKHWTVLVALMLALLVCLIACDSTDTPEQSDAETTTEAVVTTEPTTEQITTEPDTATEPATTEEEVVMHPSPEDIKAAATVVLDTEEIMAAANNEQQDWSDFGGLTLNEDGSLTALFRMGTNEIWDPYFYMIKQDTTVDNILVIKYRSSEDQTLNLYMGTEGNAATGAGDHVAGEIYATGDDWGYAILDLTEVANAYDEAASSLGYLRFGLSMAESGATIDFGFVAFFHTMEQVNLLIPQ